ncbi:hypothetical protein Trydic_g21716 [Trypoxylus dichotomus]
MSKKSKDRCCDSDTDTKSTSTYGRSCGSSSIKSTLSSAKDESLAGPSGDYACSSYSSPLSSSCSSPPTSSCLVDDLKAETKSIFQTSSMYLDKLKMYRKQLNLGDQPQLVPTKSQDSLFMQLRRTISAPIYTTKRISANSCKLQSIDEDEEQDCRSSDFSVVSSKCSKYTTDKWAEPAKHEEEIKVTPRCIEVPPKKLCVRDRTPEIIDRNEQELPQQSQTIEYSTNKGNKRFSIGDKDFILRKVNTNNIACVATQTKDAFGSQTDSDQDFYTSKSHSRNLEAGDTTTTINFVHTTETPNHMGVSLPQSVEDLEVQSIALEPNIIIIDKDEERKKTRGKIKKIGAVGDMSTDSSKSRDSESKRKEEVCRSILEDITKPAVDEPIPSTSYTPVYLVAAVYSDSTLQSNVKKSEVDFCREVPSRYYSNTEIIEREIKTIDPDPSDIFRVDKVSENLSDIIDVKSYKSILMDYSTGIKPTRTFPVHFDDLETLENKEEDHDDRFKQKASECLQFANSRHKRIPTKLTQSKWNIETERRSQTTKNASIIDMRKSQQTDINYYLVGSSSESSIISEAEEEPPSPGVKPDVIQWEHDEESQCCSCFASLRFL